MWIKVKFFTISCISSNLNRVEKQLLPVGGEKQAVNGMQGCEGSGGEEALTVLTHVVDRQDRGPAGGAGAVEGGVHDAVRGLDVVLLEGKTLISHPRHKTHIRRWYEWKQEQSDDLWQTNSPAPDPGVSWQPAPHPRKNSKCLSMFGLFLWVYLAALG